MGECYFVLNFYFVEILGDLDFLFSNSVFSHNLQELAAVLCVARMDAFSLLFQSSEFGRAKDRRNGICHFQNPALPCHQIRVGWLACVGRHLIHHTFKGKSLHECVL